jgi:hypothetical protein
MQNAGALKYALYFVKHLNSLLFPFRSKFLILFSKEKLFVRGGNVADKLEYNEASALRVKKPIILEKLKGDFAKFERRLLTMSFCRLPPSAWNNSVLNGRIYIRFGFE